MRKSIQIAVALVLSALLLYFVVDIREVGRVLAAVNPSWALLTVVAITFDRMLMSYKWGLLLRARGHRVSLAQAIMVYCSAMVWGLALPSTVGADAIRAALIRRQGVSYNDSVATILVERGIGFVSALGMAFISLLTLRFLLPDAHRYDLLILAAAAVILLTLALLTLSFTRRAFDAFMGMLPRRWQHAKVLERLARLHETYCSLATDRWTLARFTALTCAQQVWLIGVTWLIARSLSLDVHALYVLAAAPLAFLAARLPISFDGIGIYEAIFVAALSVSGLQPAESFAIALCGRAYNLVTWLPWFLAFVFRGGSAPAACKEAQ